MKQLKNLFKTIARRLSCLVAAVCAASIFLPSAFAAESLTPNTGDTSSPIWIPIALAGASVVVVVVILLLKRRSSKK